MFKKLLKKIAHNKKGFTLLETLVAVFILTLALTGPIYIATLAIRSSVESRDNISAYYLAEEALEVIRNRRDTYTFANPDADAATWLDGITDAVDCKNAASAPTINSCYMMRSSSGAYSFLPCTGGVCPQLSFNPIGNIIYGEEGFSGLTLSKFRREIYLQTGSQDPSTTGTPEREVNVVVTVKWFDRGRDREFKLVERLYNQQYGKYYAN